MRRLSLPILLLVLVGLTACTGITDVERDTDAPVQTDQLEYVLRASADESFLTTTIAYTYENRTNAPICMTHCGGAFQVPLEKRVAGEWFVAWIPAAIPACVSRTPITIEPGESFRDTLRVSHATGDNAQPKISGDLEGVYRLNIAGASRLSSPDQCSNQQVPEQERISNRFVLRRE